MERKIDFFIIGAAKSGTTSLDYYLSQHPDIFLPDLKDAWTFVDAGTNTVFEKDFGTLYKNLGGG